MARANGARDLVGTVCLVGHTRPQLMMSDKILRLMPREELTRPDFLKFVLTSTAVRSQIDSLLSGSTGQGNISQDAVRNLWVPDVPLDEQRRIVEMLGGVSDTERSIKEAIVKIRKVRQGILLASLAPVSRAEISHGWVNVPLKEVVPSTDYGISEALVSDPHGVPVLRMNNIRDGRMDIGDLRYCPTSVPDRLALHHGDVLFNRTNSIEHVGKTAMWKDELPTATFASYLVRLNPDLQRLMPEYLVEWLQHPLIRQRVKAISTVAVQQVNVNPTRLRELEIDLPIALEDQREIVTSLAACDDRIRREEEELAKLRQLKIGLADDLLAGRVIQPQLG
ncbi:restriction endonuclease subunit S [Streptomyces sp. NBC_00133]|uniref:restriction endonuclease subunit S n=1 Tax=Streptomyces sp. NBC_00133 TaxID=2903624 RepID=UPI00324EED7D